MLDFIDETLRQMTLLVPVFVIISTLFTILPGWNDYFGPAFAEYVEKLLCVIRAVGNQAFKIQFGHQSCRLSNVMPLATRQAKAQGIPQGIHTHVDFGTEPASAAAERLFGLATVFFDAPAAHGWARITVLSRIRFSISGSSANC